MCACVRVVTFYFTLKAISIFLRHRLLVSFLVVLLGTLTVVVHPLNSILLRGNTRKGFILKRNKNTSASWKYETVEKGWFVSIKKNWFSINILNCKTCVCFHFIVFIKLTGAITVTHASWHIMSTQISLLYTASLLTLNSHSWLIDAISVAVGIGDAKK